MTAQAVANNSLTSASWNSTPYVQGGVVSGGSGLTAPSTGFYLALWAAQFAANATGRRYASVTVAGTAVGLRAQIASNSASDTTSIHGSELLQVTAGQAVSVQVIQTSGGTLNTDVELAIIRLS